MAPLERKVPPERLVHPVAVPAEVTRANLAARVLLHVQPVDVLVPEENFTFLCVDFPIFTLASLLLLYNI